MYVRVFVRMMYVSEASMLTLVGMNIYRASDHIAFENEHIFMCWEGSKNTNKIKIACIGASNVVSFGAQEETLENIYYS